MLHWFNRTYAFNRRHSSSTCFSLAIIKGPNIFLVCYICYSMSYYGEVLIWEVITEWWSPCHMILMINSRQVRTLTRPSNLQITKSLFTTLHATSYSEYYTVNTEWVTGMVKCITNGSHGIHFPTMSLYHSRAWEYHATSDVAVLLEGCQLQL